MIGVYRNRLLFYYFCIFFSETLHCLFSYMMVGGGVGGVNDKHLDQVIATVVTI